MNKAWNIEERKSRVFVFSLHSGHDLREEVQSAVSLSDADRFREEDPYVDQIASRIDGTHVVVDRSRFEVDLNRPFNFCVYSTPEEAWGLDVWGDSLTDEIESGSQHAYKQFYSTMRRLFSRVKGKFIVWDLHSYNRMRRGVLGRSKDNPEINLGTRNNGKRWKKNSEHFLVQAGASGYDVGENVKFGGGYLSQWVAENFGERACTLSIEFRKDLFMDEVTGVVDEVKLEKLGSAIKSVSWEVNKLFLEETE